MPNRRKIGILAIFMTGLLAVISSILGLVYRVRLLSSPDYEWNQAVVIVEINVAIVCSSMPAFASFFRHFFYDSAYITSLPSQLLNRFRGSSSRFRSYFGSKSSYPATFMEHADSRSRLPGDTYLQLENGIRLNESAGSGIRYDTSGSEAGIDHPRNNGGITKSVKVDFSYR
ncbi:MAG: hypothetical protein M1830_008605 [Pleopsidium flavum]|nr:MAG: hypothetical protein M1830_008605 [Pleopsidium flavum]